MSGPATLRSAPGLRHAIAGDALVIGFDARFVDMQNICTFRLAPAMALYRLLLAQERSMCASRNREPTAFTDVERVANAIRSMALALAGWPSPTTGGQADFALDVQNVLGCMAGGAIGAWQEATQLAATSLGVREFRVVGEGIANPREVTEIATPHFRAVYQRSA